MALETSPSRTNGNAPRSLADIFVTPKGEFCQRCQQRVYQMEKIGPVNEVIFHRQCFKCSNCQQRLALKTYFTNAVDVNDNEIYCAKCVPKTVTRGLDSQALGYQGSRNQGGNVINSDQIRSTGHAPKIGSDAVHIKNAVAQSKHRKHKHMTYSKHHFPEFLAGVGQAKMRSAQEELEIKQRVEEDRLMRAMLQERAKDAEKLKAEMDQEWEVQIKELASKYEKKGTKKEKKGPEYEQQMDELKKNLTVKMAKKKEAMTLRFQKTAQEQTADMVKEHSKQMLDLLQKQQEDMRHEIMISGNGADVARLEEAMAVFSLTKDIPLAHPPRVRKRDLYTDPMVFDELDKDVINVAEEDQATFTDLVHELTQHCLTDLQKARAIFRWITVKDLNVLEFEENSKTDTPMGLLRGIKFGTETYHTLFMRLCSYAGLPCHEIKGHSKSVGYEPGMRIRNDAFQNTWNAVLVDGDWWPVQCNWGARHLVLNKDAKTPSIKNKKEDKIRYQYDEHYFLTDPDEFIQEFWAKDPEWQLLEKPITLEEFEAMPFVRSIFFHYGLEFENNMKSVLETDNKGGCEIRVRVPDEYARDLVFHYQIRFADRDRRNDVEYKGAKLERFVFHSLVDGLALFSVHVPTTASYFLEIFANKIDETNRMGDDPNAAMMPFRLKCACKFKIVCDDLVGKMHPLPNCASGEWGPSKGRRHFGLKPLTHDTGVINVDNDVEIQFDLPRPLHFLCKLRMNGTEDHHLEHFVAFSTQGNVLTVRARPPQQGQFGLDIYARPEEAKDNHTLAHACKYLLNCVRVDNPVEMPSSKVVEPTSKMSKEKWGPSPEFSELGMTTISHPEPRIEKLDTAPLIIDMGIPEKNKISFHLIREPDEDCRDAVHVKESGKKTRFTVTFRKSGHYMFAIYAKRKDSDVGMLNVYNYHIKFKPAAGSTSSEDSDSLKNKRKRSLFSSKK